MSHLISLRQRISVVETIRKTTNAMRLIAMSAHTRLRQAKSQRELYARELEKIMALTAQFAPSHTHSDANFRRLLIVLGSQKGLCGTFNNTLWLSALREYHDQWQNTDLVLVGKQLIELVAQDPGSSPKPIATFPGFSLADVEKTTHELHKLIRTQGYNAAVIYSMLPKTFFMQRPATTDILSIPTPPHSAKINDLPLFETPAQEIFEQAQQARIRALIESRCIESLLAEQAARFLSMDGATRNAETLIASMRLDYNKLRQATITRELTDLGGGGAS